MSAAIELSTLAEGIEDPSFYEDEPAQVPPSDIVAYNELRSCADLYRGLRLRGHVEQVEQSAVSPYPKTQPHLL
jgi:hypothetical protein